MKISNKVLFALCGAIIVPLFMRMNIHGTGMEGDPTKYIIPFLVGSTAGFFLGMMRDRLLILISNQQKIIEGKTADLISANQQLEKKMEETLQAQKENAKLEKQLRHAEKMEAIGTMAGGIAHNFNNINASILGFAELLKEEIPQEKKLVKDVKMIIDSAFEARELVKKIMMFSQQDEYRLEKNQADILTVEAVQYLMQSLPEQITVRRDVLQPCEIIMNSFQFNRIILNLCDNAIEAMGPRGGVLDIGLKRVELTEEDVHCEAEAEPGSFVEITVADSGHGIAPEIIDRIFDPFFTTKEVGKGEGIGLSVVHGIVHKGGGMIKVESEVGKGSKFHVFLPLASKRTNERD